MWRYEGEGVLENQYYWYVQWTGLDLDKSKTLLISSLFSLHNMAQNFSPGLLTHLLSSSTTSFSPWHPPPHCWCCRWSCSQLSSPLPACFHSVSSPSSPRRPPIGCPCASSPPSRPSRQGCCGKAMMVWYCHSFWKHFAYERPEDEDKQKCGEEQVADHKQRNQQQLTRTTVIICRICFRCKSYFPWGKYEFATLHKFKRRRNNTNMMLDIKWVW